MKAEDARRMTDAALDSLARSLEQGKSEALTRYLTTMARFHRYSFGNIMLIVTQRPDATQVAGFHTWKQCNRWVKKGEKGIVIIAPMVLKPKDTEATRPDQDESRVWFRAVHVFDLSQTDGEPLPEAAVVKGEPGDFTNRLRAHIQSRGIRITHEHIPAGALGVSKGGEIRTRPDLAPAQQFEVLVHELAHEMLHHGESAIRGSKTAMETEAEAVAFVVCHAIGLDTTTAASDYIQLHQGSKETLASSLDRIQKTANAILECVA